MGDRQKIEELTLHQIAQEKRSVALEAENEKLKIRLASLERVSR